MRRWRVLWHTTSGMLHSALPRNQPLRTWTPASRHICDLHANSRRTVAASMAIIPAPCRCDIITQHSDTLAPQIVYKNYGGVGIGYNSNMRELVGDSVLTAPMLNWGPLWEIFIAQLLRGEWQENTQPWPGAHEGAVKLMPTFSPRVPPETVQFVLREQEKLIAAAGDEAFKHIFCGPLLKRWAYDFADPAAGSGPRAQGCGYKPVWRRLDPPEQVNLNHYRDKDGNPLPADRTVPLETDCLWGRFFPGQALLFTAYPFPAFTEEDDVFSDYLLDNVELMEPGRTEWGILHNDSSHTCEILIGSTLSPIGDRFFELLPSSEPTSWRDCQKGHFFVEIDGVGTCVGCLPGTFEVGRQQCQPADSEHYIQHAMQDRTALSRCPENKEVLLPFVDSPSSMQLQKSTGASSIDQCVCKPGFFLRDGANSSEPCDPCPEGALCYGGPFQPIALRGYGQFPNAPLKFFKCPTYHLCSSGGEDAGECSCLGGEYRFSKTNATDASNLTRYVCAEGYVEGSPLCADCADLHALQFSQCKHCSLGPAWYVLATIVFVVVWFPTMRELITRRITSLYTTLSFIQFLGIISKFDVPWRDGITDLFQALSLFNLDLDAVHITCSGVSYEAKWLLQTLLPLFYIVFVAAVCAVSFAMQTTGVNTALGIKQWTPRDGVAPGLFFLNMYYYNGITTSFEMLLCKEDGTGGEYLIKDPSITCWQGDHTGLAAVGILSLLVYMLLVPSIYAIVIGFQLPRYGLQNPALVRNFGFLYERFLPESYYWELVETQRKFVFALVAELGIFLAQTEQCFLALSSVLLTMTLEMLYHPFKSALYDVIEEFTTGTETAVFVLSLLVLYRSDTASSGLSWVEPLAWVFLIASFTICVLTACADLKKQNKLFWISAVRKRTGCALRPEVFDLQTVQFVIPSYVSQANDGELSLFKSVEEMVIPLLESTQRSASMPKTTLTRSMTSLTRSTSRKNSAMYEQLFVHEHATLGIGESPLPAPEPDTPAKAAATVLAKTLFSGADDGSIPVVFFFEDSFAGLIAEWIRTKATQQQRQTFLKCFQSIQMFERRRRDKEVTWTQKLSVIVDQVSLRKHVHQKDKAVADWLAKHGLKVGRAWQVKHSNSTMQFVTEKITNASRRMSKGSNDAPQLDAGGASSC